MIVKLSSFGVMMGRNECAKMDEILTDATGAAECRAERHSRCAKFWQRRTTAKSGDERIAAGKKDSA